MKATPTRRTIMNRVKLAALLVFAALSLSGAAFAEGQPPAAAEQAPEYSLKSVQPGGDPVTVSEFKVSRKGEGEAELVVSIDGHAAWGVMELSGPDRLIVDVMGAKAVKGMKKQASFGNAPVDKIRVGVHEDKLRLVIDLSGGIPSYEMKEDNGALRLTMKSKPVAAGATVQPAPVAAVAEESKPAPVQAPVVQKAKPVTADLPIVKVEEKSITVQQETAKAVDLPVAKAVEQPVPVARLEKAAEQKPVEKNIVEKISFKQFNGYSRVTVTLARPGDYRLLDGDGQTTMLEIMNGELRKGVERTLDVAEMAGPVESISSFADNERPGMVVVAVKLRQKAEQKVSTVKSGINWDFKWPAPQKTVESERVEYSSDKTAGATSALAVSTGSTAVSKTYKGKRISLDFKDADIHNILRLISEVSKLNIVTSDDVKGKVTVTLRNVPWDEALDIVLQSKSLGKKQVGNILRIAPADVFQREAESEAARKKSLRNMEPLYVRLIPVNYGVASEIVSQVKDVLSERGSVNIDQRTNVIIVKDMQENVIKAEGLVRNLDTQTPQVLIEARIVEANTQFVRDIGIQWGGALSFSPANGNSTGLSFPNTIGLSGGADDSRTMSAYSGTMSPAGYAVNMPAPVGAGSGGAIGLILGSAGGTANINLRLTAMETTGELKILSAPRVTTLDNKEAKIGAGTSIPISTVSAAGVNTTFVEAKLELIVTPHVTQDGSILMKIQTTKNEPDFSRTGAQGDPTILKKEASTEVLVKDGDTTVIGGIYTRKNAEEYQKVPFLAEIPVLGWLFKKRKVSDERTELLIFITPRIINRNQSTVVTGK